MYEVTLMKEEKKKKNVTILFHGSNQFFLERRFRIFDIFIEEVTPSTVIFAGVSCNSKREQNITEIHRDKL